GGDDRGGGVVDHDGVARIDLGADVRAEAGGGDGHVGAGVLEGHRAGGVVDVAHHFLRGAVAVERQEHAGCSSVGGVESREVTGQDRGELVGAQVAERSKAGGDFDLDRTHVHVARVRAADLAAAREGGLGSLPAHRGDVDLLGGVAGGGVARHHDRVARLDDLDVARGHDGRGGDRVDELEGGRNHGALGLQRGQVVQGQANGRGQDGVGGVDDQQLAVGQGDRNRARIHVDDDEVVAVGTAGG